MMSGLKIKFLIQVLLLLKLPSCLIMSYVEWAKEYGTAWHRSKSRKAGQNSFCSYMMNKKWTLEEEFNNHLLRFQQVALSMQ